MAALGLFAALSWAAAGLLATGVSRRYGADVVMFWSLVSGAATAGAGALAVEPLALGPQDLARIGAAGAGLVLAWWSFVAAVGRGPVGPVSALTAVDGAVAATVGIATGERVSIAVLAALVGVSVGVVVVCAAAGSGTAARLGAASVALSLASAAGFATFLIAASGFERTGPWWGTALTRVSALLVLAPVLLARRRMAAPARVVARTCLVGVLTGVGVFAFIVSTRDGLAVPSVLASTYAAWMALGGLLMFGERLGRVQVAGVAVICVGLAALGVARA